MAVHGHFSGHCAESDIVWNMIYINNVSDAEFRSMTDKTDWKLHPKLFEAIDQQWGPWRWTRLHLGYPINFHITSAGDWTHWMCIQPAVTTIQQLCKPHGAYGQDSFSGGGPTCRWFWRPWNGGQPWCPCNSPSAVAISSIYRLSYTYSHVYLEGVAMGFVNTHGVYDRPNGKQVNCCNVYTSLTFIMVDEGDVLEWFLLLVQLASYKPA